MIWAPTIFGSGQNSLGASQFTPSGRRTMIGFLIDVTPAIVFGRQKMMEFTCEISQKNVMNLFTNGSQDNKF